MLNQLHQELYQELYQAELNTPFNLIYTIVFTNKTHDNQLSPHVIVCDSPAIAVKELQRISKLPHINVLSIRPSRIVKE